MLSMVLEARVPFSCFSGSRAPPARGPGPKVYVFERPGLSPKESRLQNLYFFATSFWKHFGHDLGTIWDLIRGRFGDDVGSMFALKLNPNTGTNKYQK